MRSLRLATFDDLPAMTALIGRSVRALSAGYYSDAQVEAALVHVFGVDTQLLHDGTYYAIESQEGELVAVGGWSRRRTLYGGDQTKVADDPLLDPAIDGARIRAFFVDPAWSRRGLGRRLFETCSAAAKASGFRTLELMSTLPGEPFYQSLEFIAIERPIVTLPGGVALPLVRMTCQMVGR